MRQVGGRNDPVANTFLCVGVAECPVSDFATLAAAQKADTELGRPTSHRHAVYGLAQGTTAHV